MSVPITVRLNVLFTGLTHPARFRLPDKLHGTTVLAKEYAMTMDLENLCMPDG